MGQMQLRSFSEERQTKSSQSHITKRHAEPFVTQQTRRTLKDPEIVFDCETYPDYFMVTFLSYDGSYERMEAIGADAQLSVPDRKRIWEILGNADPIISFNGEHYDLAILEAATKGRTAGGVNLLSHEIIDAKTALKPTHLKFQPQRHIDVQKLLKGRTGLKETAGRLHAPVIENLPINPTTSVADQPEMLKKLRKYCLNDCVLTARVYNQCRGAHDLRCHLNAMYNIPENVMGFCNTLESQFGELMIRREVGPSSWENTFRAARKRVESLKEISWHAPKWLKPPSPQLQKLMERCERTSYTVGETGTLKSRLAETWDGKFEFKGTEYKLGVGGLHSSSPPIYTNSTVSEKIVDLDVASYYPSLILKSGRVGFKNFRDVYGGLLERRLDAKANGRPLEAEVLKIGLNGTFGKFNSVYSGLYNPALLLDTTLTGQFALLDLVDRVTDAGAYVLQANTDGITLSVPVTMENRIMDEAVEWMRETKLSLKRTDYKTFAQRDVNNYIAITDDGAVKCKGDYQQRTPSTALSLAPNYEICQQAIANYLKDGTPVSDTIESCDDIRLFLKLRKQTLPIWCGDENVGRIARWYRHVQPHEQPPMYRIDPKTDQKIKVAESDGCALAMDLGDPDLILNVDKGWYIKRTLEMLERTGLERLNDQVQQGQLALEF